MCESEIDVITAIEIRSCLSNCKINLQSLHSHVNVVAYPYTGMLYTCMIVHGLWPGGFHGVAICRIELQGAAEGIVLSVNLLSWAVY